MKLPSLDSLISKTNTTFRRFSLSIILTLIGAGCAILILHLPYELEKSHHYYWNLLMSCYLGMLLFIATSVYCERVQMKPARKMILHLIGFAFIVLYYFFLPDHFMAISVIRFALFSIGLHLLIAFAPFIGSGELNGFWQYNKIIFLRILTSALYSAVLYIGLALAIFAIDQLFKVHIDGKTYGDLWIFIAGVFNTWFFLAGFPSEFETLEAETDYPKGLKIFTQYVLLPLITVYLLILYAYMLKIIFTGEWPEGWVSYLVLGFSIAGILSLLLIHPVRNDENNKWMLVFSRFFYFAIFPLIILLFLAIKRRISDYGITENRYFVLVLALWLVFIAIYFLSSKIKNIKLIPISLCLVAFLSSFGPWGAFEVSLRSQKKHLSSVLEKNKMLSDGKIMKAADKIPFDDHKEISSVIEYLVEVHGYETLQPFFVQNLDSLMKSDSTINLRYSYGQANKILGLMNISYVGRYVNNENQEQNISYRSESNNTVDINGYDYFISNYSGYRRDSTDTICSSYQLGKNLLVVCFHGKKNQVSISDHSNPEIIFDVSALVDSVQAKHYEDFKEVKAEEMMMTSGNDKLSARILFRNIYGVEKQDTLKLTRIEADIMIRFNREKENEVGERNQ